MRSNDIWPLNFEAATSHFIFYGTLVSNVKGNKAKSNKSELWNRLSYRCLFLKIMQISNSILIRSSSNVMGNQGRNLFFRQECSEFLETVGGPYLMGPRHDESCKTFTENLDS